MKQVKMLRTKKKVKLSVLEIAMTAVALKQLIDNYVHDDDKALYKAYKRLYKRLGKEARP